MDSLSLALVDTPMGFGNWMAPSVLESLSVFSEDWGKAVLVDNRMVGLAYQLEAHNRDD